MVIQFFRNCYFRIPIFLRLLLTVIAAMFFFGYLIHLIEPANFPTFFDGIWWTIVTAATVGYGDLVPHTFAGKLLAMFLILTGGGVLTIYLATIAAGTVKYAQNLSKGEVAYRGNGHIVVVGWNERTRNLLLLLDQHHPEEKIVLIDQSLKRLPFEDHHLHFINGNASEDAVLEKANIRHAALAVITANSVKNEKQADYATVLTTIAMRGNNSNMRIVSEILTKDQQSNAKRAGADIVVRTNDFMSNLFYHELYLSDQKSHLDMLLHFLKSKQFHLVPLPHQLAEHTYFEAARHFARQDQILIGYEVDGELRMNPVFEETMHAPYSLVILREIK